MPGACIRSGLGPHERHLACIPLVRYVVELADYCGSTGTPPKWMWRSKGCSSVSHAEKSHRSRAYGKDQIWSFSIEVPANDDFAQMDKDILGCCHRDGNVCV